MFGQKVTCPGPVLTARKGSCLLTSFLAVLQITQGPIAQASGHPDLVQTTPQIAVTQNSPEGTALESGQAIERDLAGGQRHVYQLTLAEGQYLRVEVKQLSSTVLISLQRPDGKTLRIHDLPDTKEVLTVERVAESPGIYRLNIYSRAKANLRSSGVSDDGILTALEASGLNLWGTKLVVLSACDTGLGEVRNDEGVYGLRRAFVLAGAESLVMSLWPVSDYATRNLMISYYKNLKLGMGRGAALRQVQLDLLKRNRQLHPFYWANFIQSGEWTNLDSRR